MTQDAKNDIKDKRQNTTEAGVILPDMAGLYANPYMLMY